MKIASNDAVKQKNTLIPCALSSQFFYAFTPIAVAAGVDLAVTYPFYIRSKEISGTGVGSKTYLECLLQFRQNYKGFKFRTENLQPLIKKMYRGVVPFYCYGHLPSLLAKDFLTNRFEKNFNSKLPAAFGAGLIVSPLFAWGETISLGQRFKRENHVGKNIANISFNNYYKFKVPFPRGVWMTTIGGGIYTGLMFGDFGNTVRQQLLEIKSPVFHNKDDEPTVFTEGIIAITKLATVAVTQVPATIASRQQVNEGRISAAKVLKDMYEQEGCKGAVNMLYKGSSYRIASITLGAFVFPIAKEKAEEVINKKNIKFGFV